jgi:acyl-CoA hydrolase
MKNWLAEYGMKVISAEEAVQKIKSGMEVVVSATSEPRDIMEKFETVEDGVSNVKVFSFLTVNPYEAFVSPAKSGQFEMCSWFHGACARAGMAARSGCISYVPNMLHNAAIDFLETRIPNIFFGTCTPPDKHGFVSLGLGAMYEKDMVEAAEVVILEVNEGLPRVFGDTAVHINDVDFFVESGRGLLPLPKKDPDETDLVIGNYIAELVPDGATIQLGIGGIPNAVSLSLEKKRDLGVHTEMLVDSMKHLYEIGVITNKKKALHKDKFVCAFMFGSQELYDWTDNNVAVSVLRARYVNDPAVIRQNSKMTSINTCFMVDLTGQVFSESIGTHQYSGTGGQFDTAVGAREGLDGLGKSIIACRSTAKSGKISRIVSVAPQGTPVTLQRGVSDYIVTEHGVAWLRGKTVRERTESLISIAHPDFREQLKEEAQRMGYMEMPTQGPSYQPLSVVRASK